MATALLNSHARWNALLGSDDMVAFWCTEHRAQGTFSGVLIRWTPVQDIDAPAAGRAA